MLLDCSSCFDFEKSDNNNFFAFVSYVIFLPRDLGDVFVYL